MIGKAGREWASWVVLATLAGPVFAQTPPPPSVPPAVSVPQLPPSLPPAATVTQPPSVPPAATVAQTPTVPPAPTVTLPPPRLVTPPKQPDGPPDSLLPQQKSPRLPPRPPVRDEEPTTPRTLETPLPKSTLPPQVPPGVLTSVSPAGVAAAGMATRPVDLKPLPGSLEDQLDHEYAARAGFRHCVWTGTTITGLPSSLIWEPPFAIKREPRMLVLPTSLDNYRETWTLDSSIGTTVGLWRFEPAGRDAAYQIDVFGVVHSRWTPNDLITHDVRFGIPLTSRRGPWQFKLAYEHTSSHLGDDLLRAQPLTPLGDFRREEAVVGIGRWFAEQVRVYGQAAYAFTMTYPNQTKDDFRWRFDAGFEWFCPQPTGFQGTPFVALNIDSRGDSAFQPGVTAQAGWLWRNPYQRLANIRLFAEYTNSHSQYGQFYLNREKFYAVGLSCDY